MTDSNVALVCPECGAEYLPGIATCGDCLVDLVDPAVLETLGAHDHETTTYDLSDWTKDKCDALIWRLSREHINNQLAGRALTVSHRVEEIVDQMIDDLDEDDLETASVEVADVDVNVADVPLEVQSEPRVKNEIASPGRRFAAFVGDTIFNGIVTTVILNIELNRDTFEGSELRGRFAIGVLLTFVLRVAFVAVWGQTVGNRIVRTRIVTVASRQIPSWWSSLVRALVGASPFLLQSIVPVRALAPVAGAIGFVLALAVFVPIVATADRRGLHDLAASTVVVRTSA